MTTAQAIYVALESGPKTAREIAEETGLKLSTTGQILTKLKGMGLVVRTTKARWVVPRDGRGPKDKFPTRE